MADTRQDGWDSLTIALITALFVTAILGAVVSNERGETIRSLRQQLSQPCERRK